MSQRFTKITLNLHTKEKKLHDNKIEKLQKILNKLTNKKYKNQTEEEIEFHKKESE